MQNGVFESEKLIGFPMAVRNKAIATNVTREELIRRIVALVDELDANLKQFGSNVSKLGELDHLLELLDD